MAQKIVSLLLILCLNLSLYGQEGVIKLNNPSFEDEPQPGKTPRGWYNCGQAGESPPDIQPNDIFKVEEEAQHGKTYLGFVVRENETWEAVGQKLETPLKGGRCYELSAHIARAKYYVSLGRVSGQEVNYATGSALRIWGSNDEYCDRDELLINTERIINREWMEVNFILEPEFDCKFITIEAYYVIPTMFAYNGNIILDNLSDIVPIPCEEGDNE